MINYLNLLENPQMNFDEIFRVMCDLRKGGLNPMNFNGFMIAVKQLPSLYSRQDQDYRIFDQFNLVDISEEDTTIIFREIAKRGIEKSKLCWHPNASNSTCNVDDSGKIIVSASHSIQNNGVLSRIVEDGHVMGYSMDKAGFDGKKIGKNHASIFWGFCNFHDSIFRPIEAVSYTNTREQNFLFAYRGFVVSSHKKIEVSNWINFGEQSEKDINENKKIFDNAILKKDYSIIETEVFELPNFYPVAVSSSFYLDFDFEGNPLIHSDTRMEVIYITLLPTETKTYFLLSYLGIDKVLYGNLGHQLRKRNNLKSDITMLIAAHVENVYFNPTYYSKYIEKYEQILERIMFHTQMDLAEIDINGQINIISSYTPRDYLNNPYGINFFGY